MNTNNLPALLALLLFLSFAPIACVFNPVLPCPRPVACTTDTDCMIKNPCLAQSKGAF